MQESADVPQESQGIVCVFQDIHQEHQIKGLILGRIFADRDSIEGSFFRQRIGPDEGFQAGSIALLAGSADSLRFHSRFPARVPWAEVCS